MEAGGAQSDEFGNRGHLRCTEQNGVAMMNANYGKRGWFACTLEFGLRAHNGIVRALRRWGVIFLEQMN